MSLVCFPHAGGGASFFKSWLKYLHEDIELLALQLPGREELLSETPNTDIQNIVSSIIPILTTKLDKPFYFFGHSMGAILAYEIIKRFEQLKFNLPEKLFVSGFRAVHLPDRNPKIHKLNEEKFLHGVRLYDGISIEVEKYPELLQLMLPALLADFTAVENYSYTHKSKISVPIVAFGGKEDKTVDTDELQDWSKHTNSAFNYYLFKGGHFYLSEKITALMKVMELHMDIKEINYQ